MSGNPRLSPDVDVEGVEAARDDRDIVTLGPALSSPLSILSPHIIRCQQIRAAADKLVSKQWIGIIFSI